MPVLRDVVQGLAARPDVDAVVVLSSDGLPIDHAGRTAVDTEAVAALAATFINGARRLGEAVECDSLTAGVDGADQIFPCEAPDTAPLLQALCNFLAARHRSS